MTKETTEIVMEETKNLTQGARGSTSGSPHQTAVLTSK